MTLCPCDSGKDFSECCELYLDGRKKPATAEDLMRSRYTAFAKRRLGYLEQSIHPRARSKHDAQGTREWSVNSEWLGLSILSTEAGGPEDDRGTVEFIARYRTNGSEVEHHERAEFRREGDTWYFVDGKVQGGDPIQREAPKVGRNDPCPCGSGKKYKKCCG